MNHKVNVCFRFKTKYHPEECAKRKEEIRKALKRRCEVFMEFMESGRVASVACDIERNEELVKLLDAGKINVDLDFSNILKM